MYGSQQLRLLRRAIRDGLSIKNAAEQAGMSLAEARLHHADYLKNPPPAEAFQLLYDPATLTATCRKDAIMANAQRKEDGEGSGISGEYNRPDAKSAIKIYKSEIAPKKEHISTITGDLSDPYKRIKDDCNFPRKILDLLFQLYDMEDAKRDHWMLAFRLGCEELNLSVPRDLVSIAEGKDGESPIPTNERERPRLVTVDGAPDKPDDGEIGRQKWLQKAEEKAAADAAKAEAEDADQADSEPLDETEDA
ncbi:hypothetical protein GRI39_02080 [Altererythrobacter indicus]|uniref:Uncharacterized protein n=1 Tax=Altericroceibacterium indicum TaxID=374177 RepID=A0A845A7N5_9SPHN|nr:hypothetical protein [Altericroceibacterium indicum]MXP24835.1 hypothetical protein [Altericroceibacterium indicum]